MKWRGELVTSDKNKLEVLIVDDSPDFIWLLREIADESATYLNFTDVNDGITALAYLQKVPPYDNRAPVDVVFLDLNMPGMDGWEVLKNVRGDKRLKDLPIVVLTSSTQDSDARRAFHESANTFVTKPTNIARLRDFLTVFERFWESATTMPQTSF